MPAIKLKRNILDLDFNPGRRDASARQPSRHCGLLIVVFSPLCHEDRLILLDYWFSVPSPFMDWAVDTMGLIITSVTCCGQEAQSVSDTSGGRSVSLVLPTRTPEAMMKLPIKDLLGNSCVIHTNDMSTPLQLCSLQKCLNSTDVAYFEYIAISHVWQQQRKQILKSLKSAPTNLST